MTAQTTTVRALSLPGALAAAVIGLLIVVILPHYGEHATTCRKGTYTDETQEQCVSVANAVDSGGTPVSPRTPITAPNP